MPNTRFKTGDIVYMPEYPGEMFTVERLYYYGPERIFYYVFRCIVPGHENEVIECNCNMAKKYWILAPETARLLYTKE